MMRVMALVVGLTACGRIGFDPPGGSTTADANIIVAPDEVAVQVLSDKVSPVTPIANATVLVGTTRYMTGPDGIARIPTTIPITAHVVYAPSNMRRMFTVGDVPPGTAVVLGGQSALGDLSTMTLGAPSDPAAIDYQPHWSERCSNGFVNYSAPSMMLSFKTECEGESVHVTVLSHGNTSDDWIGGQLVLGAQSTAALTGSYAADQTYTFHVTNLPSNASGVNPGVATFSLDGKDYEALSRIASLSVAGPTLDATIPAAPNANAILVSIVGQTTDVHFGVSTQRLSRIAAGTTSIGVDAATLLPLLDNLSIVTNGSAQWTLEPGMPGDVIVIDGFVGNVYWSAYLAPTTSSVVIPVLPSDLGIDASGPWLGFTATLLTVPGSLSTAAKFTLDARWRAWNPIPTDGYSMSAVSYAAF